MFSGIGDLLLHPDSFFERISREEVDLIPPVLIVGGVIFFSLVPAMVSVYYSFPSLSESRYLAQITMLQHFIFCAAALPLIRWGIVAVGTHYISKISSGRGSLAATIQNTGYAMIPMLISSVCAVIIILIALFFYHSTSPDTSQWGFSFSGIISLIACIFFFWTWYLWILAVSHSQEFTFRKAAVVTVLPVIILMWLTIPVIPWIETIWTAISAG